MIHSLYQLRWRLLESFLLLLLAISLGASNGRVRVMGETLWYQYTTRQLTVKSIKTHQYGHAATQSLQSQLLSEQHKQAKLRAYQLNPYAHLTNKKQHLLNRNQVMLNKNAQKLARQLQGEPKQEEALAVEKQLDQISEAYEVLGNLMLPATIMTDQAKCRTILKLFQQLPPTAPDYAYYQKIADLAEKYVSP
ncbi:hypothetical protein [Lacticaseibacillus paracasei]|jgi:hypothetical protein|uniref:hypothetical protein n=1 Tax=Lacticaseibacillus paracasei TaxID=1597 RepID=UPI00066668EB|nr:hypothetical protein [Lacticaseibacillus paracasei]MBM6411315.1 hypothetical protein [Lacticaseibacillus paracasei]MDM7527946.1 hypothetical protein [Lacticaseibacillus paracasei]MDO5967858.1 hypothetical protein [Lacticaseibacillus paracasei]RND42993.1 hypothetical protein FAM18108_03036 [Lacticaseibacillus paracasei]RNE33834.1 hypothetical protein FAM6410_02481 [Lacticaseibacillus paracasei]